MVDMRIVCFDLKESIQRVDSFGLLVIFYGYRWFKELKQVPNKSEKHVYITGCDTGFGNLLAKHLDEKGFCVIAGCYTEKGEIELKKACSARLITVQLDVSDNDSIKKAAGIIKNTVGEKGLWAVVNNAGISQPSGPTEWMVLDDFKKMLNVNLLGVIAVTLSVLPFIKKAKGRVVNISSVVGRICVNSAPYSISKHGVEAFNDCLRLNMAPFGVKVLCIEPGFFKTSMSDPSFLQHNLQKFWDRLPEDVRNDYGSDYIDKVKAVFAKRIGKSLDQDLWKVVSCMAHAVSAVHPRTRYSAGWDAKFFWLPLSYMPSFITDAILLKNTIKPKACI
ncbi:retinol dehydrogenase 16-like isoform X2 [Clarias gariepinus]|uniref:retinol dehydrogenase 16-like isoform X2 n=1 Tax=Clarias gariepinus TaxID=13013 RepID=UPI00234D8632|nr:retinol dehydrogenase 16-like isoform X2 [Clarias gariepinus]